VHVTTPSGDTGTDLPNDPRSKYGDVDKNGDLVNEFDTVLRLRAAITAASPADEERQLQAVVRMLRRGEFIELPPAA